MARPKIAPEARRTATIGVRVSPAEYAALREKAAALGLTPAQWLRAAALARRLPPPPAARVNLDTYRELARIGVNLNQAVRELHAGDGAGLSREILTGLLQTVLTVQRQVIGGNGNDSEPE